MEAWEVERLVEDTKVDHFDGPWSHVAFQELDLGDGLETQPVFAGPDKSRKRTYDFLPQVMIFKVGNEYFRKQGHYDSWEGVHWTGPVEKVEVQQRLVSIVDNVILDKGLDIYDDAYEDEYDYDYENWYPEGHFR